MRVMGRLVCCEGLYEKVESETLGKIRFRSGLTTHEDDGNLPGRA